MAKIAAFFGVSLARNIRVPFSRGLLRIRRSARAFARAPGLSLALLITIALGVGSNAAVYGFLQGFTRPLSPLRGADRIVSILGQDRPGDAGPLSANDFQRINNSRGLFEWIGAVRIAPRDAVIDGRSEIAIVASVTPNLAGALKFPLDAGVVISHRLWQTAFDGNQSAVGSAIHIDHADFRVQGIAPQGLDGLYNDQSVDAWIESTPQDPRNGGRNTRDLWVLARLRRNVSDRQAQTALRLGLPRLREISVTPFTGIAPKIARGLARIGLFLAFSAGAVFFIACINVASFLLGRAFRRSQETSLRIALGATGAELFRDLLADSFVISIAGGAMGLLLGILTAHALPAFLFQQDAERLSFAPHLLPIVTASLLCVLVTVVCGMMPYLGTVTDRPWTVLQREAGLPSKAIQRLRSSLVVGQITVCCMLVVCTAVLLNGLHTALQTGAGHRLGNPILLTVQAQAQPAVDIHYFSKIEDAARSLGTLSPVAWTARLPGNAPTWRTFRMQRAFPESRKAVMDIDWLTPDSLQSLDRQPIAGRMFGIDDQGRNVAIVNEEAAAELFGPLSAGVVIRDPADRSIEIIGVVRRISNGAQLPARPTIYYGYVASSQAPNPIRKAPFRVPLVPPAAGIELDENVVSANYFAALGMPFIAGQPFPNYQIPGQGRVAVINQEAADLYFSGNPLGAGVIDENGVRTEIIGVVRSQTFGTFQQHAEPAIYFPMGQDCPPRMTLILKHSKWDRAVATRLRQRVEGVSGRASIPVAINTLDAQLTQSGLAGLRIATLIGGMSAATALLLGILGLLSAQTDAERRRRRERAIRIALGAQRWRIVFLVLQEAGQLVLVGTLIGTSLSFALLRWLLADFSALAAPPFQVWLIAPLLPAAAVLIACMLPARRASRISPSRIMRES